MHPLCLEAHATHGHESCDRAPSNSPLYPPTPTDTRDGAGLTRGVVLGVHTRKRNEKIKKEESTESAKKEEKGRKQRPAGKGRQVMNGGGFDVGPLRGQGCTNRARSESEIYVGVFMPTVQVLLHTWYTFLIVTCPMPAGQ